MSHSCSFFLHKQFRKNKKERTEESMLKTHCILRSAGLTSSLSGELGQFGIRVNALVPGYIDTPMIQSKSASSHDLGKETKRTTAQVDWL